MPLTRWERDRILEGFDELLNASMTDLRKMMAQKIYGKEYVAVTRSMLGRYWHDKSAMITYLMKEDYLPEVGET